MGGGRASRASTSTQRKWGVLTVEPLLPWSGPLRGAPQRECCGDPGGMELGGGAQIGLWPWFSSVVLSLPLIVSEGCPSGEVCGGGLWQPLESALLKRSDRGVEIGFRRRSWRGFCSAPLWGWISAFCGAGRGDHRSSPGACVWKFPFRRPLSGVSSESV